MNKSPEQFKLNEETQLYLPVSVDAKQPWAATTSHQELLGQREVFGVDGHGSIRNESSDIGSQYNEKLDDSIKHMLDPKNIIDLKEQVENKLSKRIDESTHAIDKRLDKDGQSRKDKLELRSAIKKSLIGQYTQIGASEESPREVPETVINDISRMLDMSFEELESNIVSKNPEQNHLETPKNPNISTVNTEDNTDEVSDWTKQLPDISTRVRDQAKDEEINSVMINAVKSGNSEQFERAYRYLRNEVLADKLLTGSKHENFENEMATLRNIMESNAGKTNDNPLPPPTGTPVETGDTPIVIRDESADFEDDSSSSNDLPQIIVHDDNSEILDLSDGSIDQMPLAEESDSSNEENPKRKFTRRQKIAAGSLALLATGALLFGITSRNDSSNNNEPTTTITEDEPVDTIAPSQDVLDQLQEIDAEAEEQSSEENSDNADVTEEELAELEQSIKNRTVEVADTQSDSGNTPWDKATALYGDQASLRLIQAAEAVAADGIEVSWSADPYTSDKAQLFINGSNDPSIVWQFVSPRLAKEDVVNGLENLVANEAGEQVLPVTE
jgi:hypothetical protein